MILYCLCFYCCSDSIFNLNKTRKNAMIWTFVIKYFFFEERHKNHFPFNDKFILQSLEINITIAVTHTLCIWPGIFIVLVKKNFRRKAKHFLPIMWKFFFKSLGLCHGLCMAQTCIVFSVCILFTNCFNRLPIFIVRNSGCLLQVRSMVLSSGSRSRVWKPIKYFCIKH